MTGLAEWLLACIAEDEVVARAAITPDTPSFAGTIIPGGTGRWTVRTDRNEFDLYDGPFVIPPREEWFDTGATLEDESDEGSVQIGMATDGDSIHPLMTSGSSWVVASTRSPGIPPSAPVITFGLDHAARHDPARVLAECDAKGQIVKHAQRWEATLDVTPDGWTDDTATAYRMAMHWTLRVLALPYADRPGYREEWRP